MELNRRISKKVLYVVDDTVPKLISTARESFHISFQMYLIRLWAYERLYLIINLGSSDLRQTLCSFVLFYLLCPCYHC